jgi:hypothetical protein
MPTPVFTFEEEFYELGDMSDMLAAFTAPNSPATPTQAPVTQTPVMPTRDDVDTRMEDGDAGSLGGLGWFAGFTPPDSPVMPTQTHVPQTPAMPIHGDVDTRMEVGDSEMQADADLGVSVSRL